jgi:teichuronic acid biosynthesis glycosyltransferase TuaH
MKPVVILSTADMNATLWTNKQHIAVRLAQHTDVYYIESLGLRQPRFSKSDIKRVLQRLLASFSSGSKRSGADIPLPSNLRIVSPRVIPLHRYSLVRRLNSRLIEWQVQRQLPSNYDLWSFSPVTYGIERHAKTFVYHSVDLLHEVPGIPRRFFLQAEREAILRASFIVSSSKGVKSHLTSQGASQVLLWENVADIDLFTQSQRANRIARAIFAGNMTPSKVDFGLIKSVADSGIAVVLAGPSNIDGSVTDNEFAELLRHPRITYLGVLTQHELAVELGKSLVGLIPYKVNGYTAGVFPMKVYEYLASGLRVVATPISSLIGTELLGLQIGGNVNFIKFVEDAIRLGPVAETESPSLSANSWDHRIDQIGELLGVGHSYPHDQKS